MAQLNKQETTASQVLDPAKALQIAAQIQQQMHDQELARQQFQFQQQQAQREWQQTQPLQPTLQDVMNNTVAGLNKNNVVDYAPLVQDGFSKGIGEFMQGLSQPQNIPVNDFLGNLVKGFRETIYPYRTSTDEMGMQTTEPSPFFNLLRGAAASYAPQQVGVFNQEIQEKQNQVKMSNALREKLMEMAQKNAFTPEDLLKIQQENTRESVDAWEKTRTIANPRGDGTVLIKRPAESGRIIQIRTFDVAGDTLMTKFNSRNGQFTDMNDNPIKIPENAVPLGRWAYNPTTGETNYFEFPSKKNKKSGDGPTKNDLLDNELIAAGITPTPKIKMDVIKAMTDNRQKKEYINAAIGLDSINKALDMFNKNPKIYQDFINRTLNRKEAGMLEEELMNATDTVLRGRTGAALNKEELVYYKILFSPSWWNDLANARYKMELLRDILHETKNRLERPYWRPTDIRKFDIENLGSDSQSTWSKEKEARYEEWKKKQ